MTDSAAFRIWKRFVKAQSTIRTTLSAICQPPSQAHPTVNAAYLTIAHLEAAFKNSTLDPIAAYQAATQSFFL